MEFRTKVEILPSVTKIAPCERMLFVGSCFADNIGKRFQEEKFRAVVNPFGVMYNPVSIWHTVSRSKEYISGSEPLVAVFTLGTNHVYREKATSDIVDNCQKRPAALFQEEELTVDECFDTLKRSVEHLINMYGEATKVILTLSPIRYRKYGYHESQLSKATLLLAADRLVKEMPSAVSYFPAYEIMNDELRDYRFYQPDMLHPSAQAVEYIYERFAETWFSDETRLFISEWRPIKEALGHRPLNPDSDEYRRFQEQTKMKAEALKVKYSNLEL